MIRRNQCRPQLEQLEQRAVLSTFTGHRTITAPLSGTLDAVNVLQGGAGGGSGTVTADLTIGSGVLKGATIMFSGQVTSMPSPLVFDVTGTLTLTSKLGSVNTTGNVGQVDASNVKTTGMGTFKDAGNISGVTKTFKGVTG